MRNQQPAPFQPSSQPQKPYWTAGKIVALVLVAVLVVGVSGLATVNYLGQPKGTGNKPCANGAANPPSCDTCPSGQAYYAAKCYVGDFEISATQFPSSTPVGTAIQSTVTITSINGFTGTPSINWVGSGVSICDIRLPPLVANNTATITCGGEIALWNPAPGSYSLVVTGSFGDLSHSTSLSFSFFTPSCSNGATNYPDCTIFKTTTSVTCNPITIMSHQFISSNCIATVTATTSAPPTGTVTFGVSYSAFSTTCYQGVACQLTPLSGGYSSQVTMTGVTVQDNKGSLVISAHYDGDNAHLSSSGQFTLSVIDPPSTVTVTGTVSTTGLGTHPVKIEFVNTSTGVSYDAVPNSGSYTITLANLQAYNVLIDWNGALGSSGTCSAGSLNLQASTDTVYANYSC